MHASQHEVQIQSGFDSRPTRRRRTIIERAKLFIIFSSSNSRLLISSILLLSRIHTIYARIHLDNKSTSLCRAENENEVDFVSLLWFAIRCAHAELQPATTGRSSIDRAITIDYCFSASERTLVAVSYALAVERSVGIVEGSCRLLFCENKYLLWSSCAVNEPSKLKREKHFQRVKNRLISSEKTITCSQIAQLSHQTEFVNQKNWQQDDKWNYQSASQSPQNRWESWNRISRFTATLFGLQYAACLFVCAGLCAGVN